MMRLNSVIMGFKEVPLKKMDSSKPKPPAPIAEVVDVKSVLLKKQFQDLNDLTESQMNSGKEHIVALDGDDYSFSYVVTTLYGLSQVMEAFVVKQSNESQTKDLNDVNNLNAHLGQIKYLNRVLNNCMQYLSVYETVVANRLNYCRQRSSPKGVPGSGNK